MNCRITFDSMLNKRFGKLLVIDFFRTKIGNQRRSRVIVKCDCGKVKELCASNVAKGKSKSCGCLNSEIASKRCKTLNTDHGLSRHPLYIVWTAMYNRCYNKADVSYCNYGAKGVVICEEWKNDFITFYNWALANGWQKGLQIDKDIKGDGKLYSPDTCAFVSRKENGRKKSNNILVAYRGETKVLSEWCESLSLKYHTVRKRILNGISPEQAFQ